MVRTGAVVEVETIGNATLIVSERGEPLLATDVWLDEDPAYFGSWVLSHKVPDKQRFKLAKCKFIFISHFHPDHLNLASLRNFKGATILLAQHYGSRVEQELRSAGFTVLNLPSAKWISLGKSTRVMLFNNELQDSALMVEIDDGKSKSLLVNLNDSGAIGFVTSVARLAASYENSIYLALHGYGDADMINLFDKNGHRIIPAAANKFPIGKDFSACMRKFKCNIAVPFSSFHQYQRRDSWWANEYTTPTSAYSEGFPRVGEKRIYPPFQRILFEGGEVKFYSLNPPEKVIDAPVNEAAFGDSWSEKLTERDIILCRQYFNSISSLYRNFKSISLFVGGKKTEALSDGKGSVNLQFEVPRKSLIRAIKREIFDDLLIGNFMKTTITGANNLYFPDFTLSVSKYSDNGGVKLSGQLKDYFAFYRSNRSLADRLERRVGHARGLISASISGKVRNELKKLIRR